MFKIDGMFKNLFKTSTVYSDMRYLGLNGKMESVLTIQGQTVEIPL